MFSPLYPRLLSVSDLEAMLFNISCTVEFGSLGVNTDALSVSDWTLQAQARLPLLPLRTFLRSCSHLPAAASRATFHPVGLRPAREEEKSKNPNVSYLVLLGLYLGTSKHLLQ